MNKDIMKKMFPDEFELVQLGKCPFCKKDVLAEEFKDALSMKEFKISGICQKCQDKVFG